MATVGCARPQFDDGVLSKTGARTNGQRGIVCVRASACTELERLARLYLRQASQGACHSYTRIGGSREVIHILLNSLQLGHIDGIGRVDTWRYIGNLALVALRT